MEFVRRFVSPESPEPHSGGLTVDTSVLKDYTSKAQTFPAFPSNQEPQGVASPPPSSGPSSVASPPPLSVSPPSSFGEDPERFMRRRRSHSECLFLAKNGSGQALPGPCQEYISGVKQMLAKTAEQQQMQLKRRRSMALMQNAQLFK